MRLVRVKIRNFRCYQEEVAIEFGAFTSFIGKNDIGKSAILEAIAIFFGEQKADGDDASKLGERNDMRITCEFDSLPSSLILDATSHTTLQDEYLLNSNGLLEVTRIYNGATKNPTAQTFINALHPKVDGAKDLLVLKISELKARAREFNVDLATVNQSVSAEIRQAIRSHFQDLELEERLIEVDSGIGAKEIFGKIKEAMPLFFLYRSDRASTDQDSEAQDPLKVAVRLAIDQQKTPLAEIALKVREEVSDLLSQTLSKIAAMSPEIADELTPEISDPKWESVFKIGLATDSGIPLNKRGSGVRRLILLALLQAQAESKKLIRPGSGVIFAIEEPETGLHPDKQRALLQALAEIAAQDENQVIVTTHSPMLGRLLPEATLRYVTVEDNGPAVQPPSEETMRLVVEALGVLPDHRVRVFIGVEGKHDEIFFKRMSAILSTSDPLIADLESLETEGKLIFIPMGGSNAGLWISRLWELNRPEYHIFDRDFAPPADPRYKPVAEAINLRANCHAVHTSKRELENYLHPDAIKAARSEVELSNVGDFESVPLLAAEKIHNASDSETAWMDLDDDDRKAKASRTKAWLNGDATKHMTLELLNQSDSTGDIILWLRDVTRLAVSR